MYVPGSTEGESVLLTRQAHSGRIDDGHHDVNVLDDDAIEQLLVAILQTHQVDVLVQWLLEAVEVLHADEHLLILSEH